MILIVDLDNTIFETSTIEMSQFKEARQLVEDYTLQHHGVELAHSIFDEMKHIAFDLIAKKYNFPNPLIQQFYQIIESGNYQLKIDTFPDYHYLLQYDYPKYLVTTGLPNLQNAKIEALGIREDFEQVHIDNPTDSNRVFKKGIFQQILAHSQASQAVVIGDNPISELKAGKELGLVTVQRMYGKTQYSEYADYAINSFEDLNRILPV